MLPHFTKLIAPKKIDVLGITANKETNMAFPPVGVRARQYSYASGMGPLESTPPFQP